jgi:hypothetical protein
MTPLYDSPRREGKAPITARQNTASASYTLLFLFFVVLTEGLAAARAGAELSPGDSREAGTVIGDGTAIDLLLLHPPGSLQDVAVMTESDVVVNCPEAILRGTLSAAPGKDSIK